MKKIIKLFSVVTLLLYILSSNTVYGTQAKKTPENKDSMDWKDAFKYADEFTDGNIEWKIDDKNIDKEDNEALKQSLPKIDEIEQNIKKEANSIFKILLAIGTVLTVIVGIILGIQYVIASAEEKAKIKEKMIPYVIGNIVIYGAFTIWYLVVTVLGQI